MASPMSTAWMPKIINPAARLPQVWMCQNRTMNPIPAIERKLQIAATKVYAWALYLMTIRPTPNVRRTLFGGFIAPQILHCEHASAGLGPQQARIGRLGEPSLPFGLLKRRIKRTRTRLEIKLLHEGAGFRGAVFAVHAAVFPFDGERAGVADVIQGDDDFL